MQNFSKILILAFLAFSSHTVLAVPAIAETELDKRAVSNVCLQTITGSPSTAGIKQFATDLSGRASSKLKAREHVLVARAAPWIPDCHKLPATLSQVKCIACQDVADATYLAAVTGCTEGSLACAVFEPYCEAACVAIASYGLYSAYQQCYCLHADCSDTKKAAAAKLPAPPSTINVSNAVFAIKPLPALGQKFSTGSWGSGGKPSICNNNISLPPPASGSIDQPTGSAPKGQNQSAGGGGKKTG